MVGGVIWLVNRRSGPPNRWYWYSAWKPTASLVLKVRPAAKFQPVSNESATSPTGNVTPPPKLISIGLSCAWAVAEPMTASMASAASVVRM